MEKKQEEVQPKTFDLTVHRRDPKTGALVEVNPYVLKVIDGVQVFYRGGKAYHPNGELLDGQEPDVVEAVAPAAVAKEEDSFHVEQSQAAPSFAADVAEVQAKRPGRPKKQQA